jgi:hypothetical protein
VPKPRAVYATLGPCSYWQSPCDVEVHVHTSRAHARALARIAVRHQTSETRLIDGDALDRYHTLSNRSLTVLCQDGFRAGTGIRPEIGVVYMIPLAVSTV